MLELITKRSLLLSIHLLTGDVVGHAWHGFSAATWRDVLPETHTMLYRHTLWYCITTWKAGKCASRLWPLNCSKEGCTHSFTCMHNIAKWFVPISPDAMPFCTSNTFSDLEARHALRAVSTTLLVRLKYGRLNYDRNGFVVSRMENKIWYFHPHDTMQF